MSLTAAVQSAARAGPGPVTSGSVTPGTVEETVLARLPDTPAAGLMIRPAMCLTDPGSGARLGQPPAAPAPLGARYGNLRSRRASTTSTTVSVRLSSR